MTTVKIAWRNIWRTPLRSMIVISSIVLGIWAGIFVVAFCYGLNKQRTQSSINNSISHIQILHPEYDNDFDNKAVLEDVNRITTVLENDGNLKAYSFRTLIYGMVSSPIKSNGVKIIGINKNQERDVTNIVNNIIEGSYFDSNRKNGILIGESLAKKINVRLKSKVVLTFQDNENNIITSAFRITGIFKTQFSKYDQSHVYIQNKDLHRLTKNDGYHQVAIICNSIESVGKTKESLKNDLSKYVVKDWKDISPELAYADQVMETWLILIMVIIMLALIFGIINTMLMAVFERRKELGMLMAIGMNKSKVFSLIMIETLFLSLLGTPTGMLLGAITVGITSRTGINLSIVGEGLQSVGLSNITYPVIEPKFYFFIGIMVFLFTLIAAIYPSKKALKLKPTEAIRTL